jgi:hypothetical protein
MLCIEISLVFQKTGVLDFIIVFIIVSRSLPECREKQLIFSLFKVVNMKKGVVNKEAINFYIEDFKDTSSKLESTDQKCQFTIQLFVSFTTITVSVFAVLSEKLDLLSTNINLWFYLVIAFLIVSGECIFRYIVVGGYHHMIYVNRMNLLRVLILNACNLDEEIINNYSFNKIIKANNKGMGHKMQTMLNSIIGLLFVSVIINVFLTYGVMVKSILASLLIFYFAATLIVLNIKFSNSKCISADRESSIMENTLTKIKTND